ncbi:MAG: monovalent cation/H+ antiporter subunit D [Alphaproteobacteria bacterium]|nr:monovalent cation/H+ antiporter subunit D [Alphaproteobacteria bacterium]
MSHAVILPVLLPLVAAVAMLLLPSAARMLAVLAAVALVGVAALLLGLAADDAVRVYRLGDWQAPYGIVLVLDRLAAMMVAVTAVLGLAALMSAIGGNDREGRHFHPLFQLQMAGLNGAFLTGDVFNLFVFFEILLLASYGLLMHGGGAARARVGIGYVVLNLVGSALFLISLGLVYGTLGTLNLADIALVLPGVPAADQALVRTAAALMVAVFLLKAALLPLSFWLPHVYAAAGAPVAALFAVMTKVGVYALLRVEVIGFAGAPATAGLLQPWLPVLALLTIAAGTIGALAARRLAGVAANQVLVSTGTLLAAVAAGNATATAAALYYLPHTTLVTGGMFLLAGQLAQLRGAMGDTIDNGPKVRGALLLGGAFLVLGVAAAGVPPLSGFLAKVMVLQALGDTALGPWMWAGLLVSGLVMALVLARAASALFWEAGDEEAPGPKLPRGAVLALVLLSAAGPVLALAAAPVAGYARAAAEQLHARQPYIEAVLGARPAVQRETRP